MIIRFCDFRNTVLFKPNSSIRIQAPLNFDKYRCKHRELTTRWEMASFLGQINSSVAESDSRNTMIEERKRKRMQSNRESARRSRMKKQKQLEYLTSEVRRLNVFNRRIAESLNGREQARIEIESTSSILRVEAMEMTYQLGALNLVLQIVDGADALAVDVLDVHDPLLEPRLLNLPVQPSAADYDVFLV